MKTKKLALKILQAETDGFETQSRLRDDVLDAMVRFESENKQCNIAVVSKQRELLIAYAKCVVGGSYCMYCKKELKPGEAIILCKKCTE